MSEPEFEVWIRELRESLRASSAGLLQAHEARGEGPDCWPYRHSDVDRLLAVIDQFVAEAADPRIRGRRDEVESLVRDTILKLNALNDEVGIIESGERDCVLDLIHFAVRRAGVDPDLFGDYGWREW